MIQQTSPNPGRAHVFAFNGDADGLCALQQLRLADASQAGAAELVTGVKRDIRLLRRIDPARCGRVTALDISHDQNRDDVRRLLDAGIRIRYFDHHFAGDLPADGSFEAHIDTAADVCTSALVDAHLGGRHVRWAIVAAYGDEMPALGATLARRHGIDADTCARYAALGLHLNYNAYGECVDDLHFDPAALATLMLPYADPDDFIRDTSVLDTLRDGYQSDLTQARVLKPLHEVAGALLIALPDQPWARRATGAFANELVRARPECALAVLSPKAGGGFVVSVRVPGDRQVSAEAFCRGFATGGGRQRAGGINHLPECDVDGFAARFAAVFGAC